MNIKRTIKFTYRKVDSISTLFQIRMRVCYNHLRDDFSTGHTLTKEEDWDSENQCVVEGAVSSKGIRSSQINADIHHIKDTMEDCFKYFEVTDTVPSLKELKEKFNEKMGVEKKVINEKKVRSRVKSQTESISFWKVFDNFVDENGVKNAWTTATYEKFAALKADLRTFKKNITFDDLNEKTLTQFVCYLRDKKIVAPPKSKKDESGKLKGEHIGIKNSTIEKKLSYLKWFLKWATLKEYNNNKAYQTFKVTLKTTQKKVIYLTQEELKQLNNYQIPEGKAYLEKVRDVFLFCCFSGLRYSDAYNLKENDIKDGKIEVTTVKTADSIIIELNDVTRRLYEKYKDVPFENGKLLPVISNQKMNEYLKELCMLAGINEPIRLTTYSGTTRIDEVKPKYGLIGTHTGRKTFIVTMLSLGVPAEIVMKWTGHSSYSAMKPYIDIMDKAKEDQMKRINQIKL